MDATNQQAEARRGRWAVGAMFLINGFMVGSWAPQIPPFVERLGISEFTLGLLILGFGLGAVCAMVAAGHLIARNGSQHTLRLFAVAMIFGLLLVALAPNVPLAAVALFIFGGSIGAMDVSMNANAVVVERKLTKAVMSSSHGFWSLGGFIGGGVGGILIQNYGHMSHALLATVAALATVGLAFRAVVSDDHPVTQERQKFSLPRDPTIYVIGFMALLCMNSEGAVLDWGALYMRQELGADIATAGFAFAFFSGAMALMRFAGDGIRNRYGAVATFRVSGIISALGMLVAGLSPWPWLAIAAFAVSGLGVANMVPILFSAAGNQPGVSSGAGMSVVTTMGYSGILVAPSVIGFVGGKVGFAPVYIAVAIFLAVMVLMSKLTRTADLNRETVQDPVPI
ncbi:MAG: MFS transporter [Rhizobiaceae bacterium]